MNGEPARVALLDVLDPRVVACVREELEAVGLTLVELADGSVRSRRAALADADYAVSLSTPLTREDLPSTGRLRLVHKWGTGYDGVDLEALRERGIALLRTAGGNAVFVAELALALMMSVRRNLPEADASVRGGRWNGQQYWLRSRSIAGETVGLVGFGAIARKLASLLAPFDTRILYSSRTRLSEADETRHGVVFAPLAELLARSDIVSLHVPLTAETHHLLSARELGLMKQSAVLINTARGALIDEGALVDALKAGTIAGAGLDVFETEPLPSDHPLLALPNVVVTPHMGGKVQQNLLGAARHIARNLAAHASGRPVPAADYVLSP